MSYAFYAAGAIFVATYVLISAPRVGLSRIDGLPQRCSTERSESPSASSGILGAAANVMVVQTASRQVFDVSMWEWVRAGLPGTIATLLLATTALVMFA